MKPLARLPSTATVLASALLVTTKEARADLRFRNMSATDSQVLEGHRTTGDALFGRGTFTMRKGTCGVIVSEVMQAKPYYLRVLSDGEAYGATRITYALTMSRTSQ
jgi:uncharacterized membrane protein